MTLYSSGLFFVLTASGCIDNALTLPVSPSLQDEKTLAFGTTIHFVRDSKLCGRNLSDSKVTFLA